MRTGTFHGDGLALAVHEVGAGRAAVFQHGLCGDAGQTAEAFPDVAGWRGVTLECRGHGGSEAGPEESLGLGAFAGDLEAFVERLGEGPVVAGGISMGAALALRLAVRRPDLVRALVLVRPAWGWEAAPATLRAYAFAGNLLGRLGPERGLAAFEASDDARRLARDAPDNLSSLRGMFAREPAETTAALLTRVAADDPGVTEADLRALRLPVLAVGHGRDEAHPWSLAEALAAAIPGARLVRVTPKARDRAAHLRDLRDAVARFLTELP